MAMKWDLPDPKKLLQCLALPEAKIKMVLDTDTYNEVDDQFALCYALLSPEKLDVQAIYAAPFFNDRSAGPKDGMEKSYEEIVRLLDKMGRDADGLVYRGSEVYMADEDSPVDSPAARDLIARAKAMPEGERLYVTAIGAITNVASAIVMAPEIREKIVVVWLGGQPHSYPTAREFNLSGDIVASRVIFDCGVPFVQVPAMGVASHLLATVPELDAYLKGYNPVCDALVELFRAYSHDHFAWAKEIWDVSAIGLLIDPSWTRSVVVPAPILSMESNYSHNPARHFMREVQWLDRNAIFKDMYTKLRKA